jgi:hypothetical protein
MQETMQKQRGIAYETEEVVAFIRLHLYNRGVCCGAQAIRSSLEELNMRPLPSVRTIGRILARHGLTHGRTGIYPEDRLDAADAEAYIICNHLLCTQKEA